MAGTTGQAGTGQTDTGPWRIRAATVQDVPALDALVHELATYEGESDAVEATPQDLARALFGPTPLAHALVAESPADPADSADPAEPADPADSAAWTVCGCAVWFLTYSTWTGRGGLWLEDLVVTPSRRGRGIGSALLAALAAECVTRDLRRLEFSVLDWNTGAQSVYRAAGAQPLADWTTWRIQGNGLTGLAARHDEGVVQGRRGVRQ